MISNPNAFMTWHTTDGSYQETHPILRTPHYSSAVDQYQDDGFGNPFNTNRLPDSVNTQALDFILEDLH